MMYSANKSKNSDIPHLQRKQWHRELAKYKKDINYIDNRLTRLQRNSSETGKIPVLIKTLKSRIALKKSFLENLRYNIQLHDSGMTDFMQKYPTMLDRVHYGTEEEMAKAMEQFRINFAQFKNHFELFLKNK